MEKAFVLDTNVLIHDPNAISEFDDNTVVIPIYVIEELDTLKKFHDEKGRNAREVARVINALCEKADIAAGVPLPKKGTLMVMLEQKRSELYGLDPHHPDNRIIFTALNLKETKKYKDVVFVSKDLNARIKAGAVGLKTMDYEKAKVNIDELYQGFADITVEDNLISDFYAHKKISLDNEKYNNGNPFTINQYVVLKSNVNEKTSCVARFNGTEFVPLIQDNPQIWGVQSRNVQQRFAFDALLREDISVVTLVGQAGTGKTLLAIAAGLQQTLDNMKYSKVLVARPVIPMGKDIGFLPGGKDEKLHYWMQPIFDNLRFIFDKNTAGHKNPEEEINYLMRLGKIELEALTYIRGRTIPKQYLIIDEAQNLSPHEVKTIISRAGEGTKIVLTGDPYQIDNPYLDSESNGLTHAVEHFKGQDIAAHITFIKSERSKLASLAADLL